VADPAQRGENPLTPFLQLALALATLIAAAKAGGYISFRLGQPSVLGELLVGILLGPTLVDFLHIPYFTDQHLSEVVHELAEIGVLLLMFLVGLELHLSDLAKTGKVAAFTGVLGVVMPLLMGYGAGKAFGLADSAAVFLGLILAATSVSISAQTLLELQALRSRVGVSLLGAAVFDDILVVLGLSLFTALVIAESTASLATVLVVIGRMALYLGLAGVLGWVVLPKASRQVSKMPVSQGLIAFTMVTLLLYGWAAEELGGMAAITGAFLAGLLFARSPVKERIETGITALAYGLFVPIFFINVGLTADLHALIGDTFRLFAVMLVVAMLGKIIGAGAGALLGGLSRQEALQIGIGMMSRGEVGLIVATVGVTQGLIDQGVFAAVVGVVIITTLLTPPLLRASFAKSKSLPENSKTKNLPAAKGEPE
jgi:Kef-type K+ transport system membrane component KefB